MTQASAPAAAPQLGSNQLDQLHQLAVGMSQPQLWWASGYLAGLGAAPDQAQTAPLVDAAPVWTIFYATETGNARHLAEKLAAAATAAGVATRSVDLHDFKASRLKQESRAWFIVSTHGLGDPPEGYEDFFEFIEGARAPKLEGLEFSVLALGDSTYEDYCAVGQRLDERLAELGGRRMQDRADCDVDFDATAGTWIRGIVATAGAQAETAKPATPFLRPVPDLPRFTREQPYQAEVLLNQRITGRDSSKVVNHIELATEDSGLIYQPGDALGVVPTNPPQLVDEILALTGFDAEAGVELAGETLPLRVALAERLEITVLSKPFLESYAKAAHSDELKAALENPDRGALRRNLTTTQVVDVLHAAPAAVSAQQFVGWLRALTPRFYSIASSPDANPDEVHLTVARTEYEKYGRMHWGTASVFLTDDRTSAPVFVESKPNFRLPENGDAPIVMIGPGTGVAPFRAFVEHRQAHGAAGRNWLFFGDRNFSADFLYQTEWQRYLRDGVLTRLDLAFSRDQASKIYVQDRLREQGKELVRWLEDGAHLYVCGDADAMAPAVQQALLEVLRDELTGSTDQAEEYLRELRRAGRYQRDVY